jgi:hypothetical protein
VSADAYHAGLVKLIRVGPLGSVPWISKLVRVYTRDLVSRDGTAVLTVRWEATGSAGGLFPALDADITLSPDGKDTSRLTLDGVYRAPLGGVGAGLDRVMLNRIAAATGRSLLSRISDAIS